LSCSFTYVLFLQSGSCSFACSVPVAQSVSPLAVPRAAVPVSSNFTSCCSSRAAVPVPQSVPPLAVPRAAVPPVGPTSCCSSSRGSVPHSVLLLFLEPRFRFLSRSHLLLFLEPRFRFLIRYHLLRSSSRGSGSSFGPTSCCSSTQFRFLIQYHLLLFLEPRFRFLIGITSCCSSSRGSVPHSVSPALVRTAPALVPRAAVPVPLSC
jgi:hypothetical protein